MQGMKFIQPFLLLSFLFTLSLWSASPVPYSGKIDIRGVNYFGEAQFAFSLHDGNGTTHWRNGKQPGETIKVTIRNGRYTVLLGGQGMNSLPPELFLNHDKLYLKVEVDMGDGEGLRHLAPDQLITATPRALVAEVAKVAQVAEKVGNGAITLDMLSSEVLTKLDANGSSASVGPITRDMLPQDVRDDLNKTVTITRDMLPADVLTDLNKSSATASPITLSMLAPEVTAKLDQNGSSGSGVVVGSLISVPYGESAPAGYSLYQRGTPKNELVWEEKAPLNIAKIIGYGAEVSNGKIYVLGGSDNNDVYQNALESYDPSTNTWQTLSPMSTLRAAGAYTVINNKIFAIGGKATKNDAGIADIESYDLQTNSWNSEQSLPDAVWVAGAIAMNNRIFVFGGYRPNDGDLKQVLEYDSATKQWQLREDMPTARNGVSVVFFNNRIWVMGGYDNPNRLNAVESYDPSSNTWQTEASLAIERQHTLSWVANNKIYIGGGVDNSDEYLSSIEVYNSTTKQWSFAGNLPEAKTGGDAVVLNNTVYVIGGQTASGVYSNKVYAADLNASVAGIYDLYRKDGNASAGTPVVQAEVADGSVVGSKMADGAITANKMANNTITTSQLNEQILKYLRPEITQQPQTFSVLADSNTSFSFSAEGKYLSYQWRRNGLILAGETNSTLAITDANATQHDGNYSVVVTNEFGNVESNASEFLVINPNAISQGLVGWWPLDGNASDMSGNGNDGNVTGEIHPNSRKVGGGYYFNGVDNSINLGNSAILNPTQSMTLSAWFKIFDGKVRGPPIIERYYASEGQRSYLLKSSINGSYHRISFNVYESLSLGTTREKAISYNTYYHTVGTYDSNSIACLYVDGQLCSSQTVSSPIVASQTDTTIGGHLNSYENFFHGIIYDVRIYDRALSTAEVQALYNMGQ